MSDVNVTIDKVVYSMIEDHGSEYAADFLRRFLKHVIEKNVKNEIEKTVLSIELLGEGCLSRIDGIDKTLKEVA